MIERSCDRRRSLLEVAGGQDLGPGDGQAGGGPGQGLDLGDLGPEALLEGARPATNSSVPMRARLMATYPASLVNDSVASTKARS